MRGTAVIFVALATSAAIALALPSEYEQDQVEQGQRFIDGRWQTWDAIKDWFSPATQYVKERLPHKTPAEFVDDVKEAAKEFKDKAKSHPVVVGVSNAVKPVHQWVSETANDLSKTRFVDMYDNVVDSVRNADRKVAQWISSDDDSNQQTRRSEKIQILH